MFSLDPINTSAMDGAECAVCGADAVGTEDVAEGSRLITLPLCGDCFDDVAKCEECGYAVMPADQCRLAGSGIYCEGCYSKHPVVVGQVMAAISADERAGK